MAVPVMDVHVSLLRAFLVGDDDEYNRLCEGPEPPDAEQGFFLLFSATFCLAVARRFGSNRSAADIIRFVATARGRLGDQASEVDPRDAEHLVQAVLAGPTAMAELSEAAKEAQVPLLRELIVDERLDDAGLEEFLARARARAERIPDVGGGG